MTHQAPRCVVGPHLENIASLPGRGYRGPETLKTETGSMFASQPAAYPRDLQLPASPGNLLPDAAAAVKEEYRATTRRKRLRCLEVTLIDQGNGNDIYRLDVGQF